MEKQPAKISTKAYQCPVCKNETQVQTNHFGEIYSGCKKCGNSVLYCIEPEGLALLASRPQAKAILHYYYLNTEKPEELKQLEEIRHKMTSQGVELWDEHSSIPIKPKMKEMRQYDGQEITLYSPEQFESQYVSSVGRVHKWHEMIYPNPRIKEGYYLEFI